MCMVLQKVVHQEEVKYRSINNALSEAGKQQQYRRLAVNVSMVEGLGWLTNLSKESHSAVCSSRRCRQQRDGCASPA